MKLLEARVAGLRPLSLIDFPGRPAGVVFFSGCNLRCVYCHNWKIAWQVVGVSISEALPQILSWKHRAVVLTGGEPLLSEEVLELVERLKEEGFSVKVDTNGTFPERVKELLGKVDYWAVDVKAPPEKYKEITGVDVWDRISKTIAIFLPRDDYEFRTTVYPLLSKEDFLEIAKRIAGARLYALQQYSPQHGPPGRLPDPLSKESIEKIKKLVEPYVKRVEVRNL